MIELYLDRRHLRPINDTAFAICILFQSKSYRQFFKYTVIKKFTFLSNVSKNALNWPFSATSVEFSRTNTRLFGSCNNYVRHELSNFIILTFYCYVLLLPHFNVFCKVSDDIWAETFVRSDVPISILHGWH